MANYNYSISGDTATGAVDPDQLWIELQSLASANPGFPTLTNIQTELDDLKITYIPALSAPQEALLTGAVAAHTPVAPPAPSPTVENQIAMTDPTAADDDTGGFEPSVRWLNVSSQEEFICTNSAAGAAVWKSTTSGGGGGVSSVLTGNVLWVDEVNGNNATAIVGRLDKPYLTIGAALGAATAGDCVMVLPGTYDESSLTIPDDVSLAGVDRLRCRLIESAPSATTMVTMGANTSIENMVIEGGTGGTRTLVVFPGTSSANSVIRNCVLTGTSGNVNGVSVQGSGTSTENWVTVDHTDIKGAGVANGLITSSSGSFVVRDCLFSGVVGASITSGTVEIQDCSCLGAIGLSVSAPATAAVNQGTRWSVLNNLGSLVSANEYLQESPLAHASTHLSTGTDPIAEFVGASSGVDGLDGLVTAPLAADAQKYLRGDGTWSAVGAVGGTAFDQVYGIGASDGSLAGTADTVYATVYEPLKSMTLTEIEWFCTTGGAVGDVHVGIYNEAKDTLLASGVTTNPVTGTFNKVTLDSAVTLLAGEKYWPAIMQEDGGAAWAYSTVSVGIGLSVYTTWSQQNLPPSIVTASGGTYTPWFGFYGTQSSVILERSVYGDYYDAGTTTVGTIQTTLGLDTERQSDAAFSLASDEVTVQAGGAGTYLITYAATFNESDSDERVTETWLQLNGSEVVATRGEVLHWDEHAIVGDGTCGRTCILTLADGDVLSVQGQVTTGSGGYQTATGGVGLTITTIGSNGEQGATGPTGAGSNIIIEDAGSVVSGGPHSTLNFTGFTVADAGGGTADITAASVFGQDYQRVSDDSQSTTTSTSFQDKLTITTPTLTGTYRLAWMCVFYTGATNRSVEARLLDNNTGAVLWTVQRVEPKDVNNRVFAGMALEVVLAASSGEYILQYRVVGAGTAGIKDAAIELWRTS